MLPENSLSGFRHAIDLGVSTLELDLGVTRDRVVVVSHDPRINPRICRNADGTAVAEPGPRLEDLDLADVQAFDCGSNPDPERFPEPPRRNLPGTRIPTLSQVLDLAATDGSVRLNVEIKVVPNSDDTVPLAEFVPLVLAEIQAHQLTARVTVQCFDWSALALVKRHDPKQRTAALLAPDTLDPQWLAGLDPEAAGGTALGLLRAAPGVIDVFSPYWEQVVPGNPRFAGSSVRELQAAGFPVIPWTVNERQHMLELLELGVDGLITDYPDALIDLLEAQAIPIS